LFAAGDAASADENGYYVWARFGFDAPLRDNERAALPVTLKGATTINQIIQRDGQAWWQQFGSFRSMNFDLADGSEMMKVFKKYLTGKGIAQE